MSFAKEDVRKSAKAGDITLNYYEAGEGSDLGGGLPTGLPRHPDARPIAPERGIDPERVVSRRPTNQGQVGAVDAMVAVPAILAKVRRDILFVI